MSTTSNQPKNETIYNIPECLRYIALAMEQLDSVATTVAMGCSPKHIAMSQIISEKFEARLPPFEKTIVDPSVIITYIADQDELPWTKKKTEIVTMIAYPLDQDKQKSIAKLIRSLVVYMQELLWDTYLRVVFANDDKAQLFTKEFLKQNPDDIEDSRAISLYYLLKHCRGIAIAKTGAAWDQCASENGIFNINRYILHCLGISQYQCNATVGTQQEVSTDTPAKPMVDSIEAPSTITLQ